MPLLSAWMERLWSRAEADYRRTIIDAVSAKPARRILDLGCDDGAWTDVVRRSVAVPPSCVSGVEIVPERAELARARGFDVRTADLEDRWPFEDGLFDIVHANQVIEHVNGLDHFVEETRRVLRPGGRAVVCTENLASWHNVFALTLGYQPFSLTNISTYGPLGNPFALHAREGAGRESWRHVHIVSLTTLRDLYLAHGFAIDAAWGTGYHPLSGRLAARLAAFDPRHAHFIGVVAQRLGQRALTVAAAFYVLLPFDVIPDFLPVVGHFDDAIIVTVVFGVLRQQWFDKLRAFVRGRRRRPQPAAA